MKKLFSGIIVGLKILTLGCMSGLMNLGHISLAQEPQSPCHQSETTNQNCEACSLAETSWSVSAIFRTKETTPKPQSFIVAEKFWTLESQDQKRISNTCIPRPPDYVIEGGTEFFQTSIRLRI